MDVPNLEEVKISSHHFLVILLISRICVIVEMTVTVKPRSNKSIFFQIALQKLFSTYRVAYNFNIPEPLR